MPAPVPLPLTWRILTTVHCPSCQKDWHFLPEENGKLIRDAYCPNRSCPQHGIRYTLEMTLECVHVTKVVVE
jgi:hypothetical protein